MSKDPEDSGGLRNSLYRKETRSKRRMTPMRRFVWRIVAAIGVGIVRMFWATCRVVRVIGDEHMAKALASHSSLIPVYWHQHQLFCAKYLLEQSARPMVGSLTAWTGRQQPPAARRDQQQQKQPGAEEEHADDAGQYLR